MSIYSYLITEFADNFVDTKRLWDQAVASAVSITSIRLDVASAIQFVLIDSSESKATIDALVAAYTNDFSPGQDEIELVADGGGNIAIDLLLGNAFRIVLDGDYTLSNPTNLNRHETYLIRVIQDPGGAGNKTLSFDTAYTFEGGTQPTISVAADAVDLLTLYATYPTVMVAHMGAMS